MSEPDYLSKIGQVACELGIGFNTEERIRRAWARYEADAAKLTPPFDVLHGTVPAEFRAFSREFITLLYQTKTGVPNTDCEQIVAKNKEYGGSWCKRGGTGAFHALARKGDRIMNQLEKWITLENARADEESSEAIDDTLGDLRRYLILVEAWHVAREQNVRDNMIEG